MLDTARVFHAHNFGEHVESRDGYFASLYMTATRIARTVAEAADERYAVPLRERSTQARGEVLT